MKTLKWILGIFGGFFLLLFVIAAFSVSNEKPLPIVRAAINYLPGDVLITNKEEGPLKNCVLTLNDKYELRSVNIERETMFPAEMFADGTARFNPRTTVVTSLSVICDSPRGRVGGSRTYNPGL